VFGEEKRNHRNLIWLLQIFSGSCKDKIPLLNLVDVTNSKHQAKNRQKKNQEKENMHVMCLVKK